LSSRGGETQQGITLEEALQQLSLLENQLKQLQAAAAELEARLVQLGSLEEALADLRGGSSDVLVPLDARATVIARGEIRPLEKLIIHAGMNVFVEVGYDKAVEFVRREKAEVSKLLDAYNREIAKLSQYYAALRAAIEQSLSAAGTQS
jgi:prefoldin alpha subunit